MQCSNFSSRSTARVYVVVEGSPPNCAPKCGSCCAAICLWTRRSVPPHWVLQRFNRPFSFPRTDALSLSHTPAAAFRSRYLTERQRFASLLTPMDVDKPVDWVQASQLGNSRDKISLLLHQVAHFFPLPLLSRAPEEARRLTPADSCGPAEDESDWRLECRSNESVFVRPMEVPCMSSFPL
jgi:hypothetical protein